MPWITIAPDTIVMNPNTRDDYGRFGVIVRKSTIYPDGWIIKFDDPDKIIHLQQKAIIPILPMDDCDTHTLPFQEIWEKYEKRIHDVTHALFAQQTRNQIAEEEFRRFLPNFRSTQ